MAGNKNRVYLANRSDNYTVVFIGGRTETVNCPVGSDVLRTLIRSGGVTSYKKGA